MLNPLQGPRGAVYVTEWNFYGYDLFFVLYLSFLNSSSAFLETFFTACICIIIGLIMVFYELWMCTVLKCITKGCFQFMIGVLTKVNFHSAEDGSKRF